MRTNNGTTDRSSNRFVASFVAFVVCMLVISVVPTYRYYEFNADASVTHHLPTVTLATNDAPNIDPFPDALQVEQFNMSQLPPMMYPDEMALFSQLVIACSKSGHCEYLEWGSGGSTELVSMLMDNSLDIHAHSIEHAVPWCENMKSKDIIKTAVAINKLSFYCVDTEVPLVVYGRPQNNDTATLQKMQVYVDYVDKIQRTAKYFDLVLIDGRFRTACGLKLIVGKHIDHNSVVMVHDYQRFNRPYPFLEKYYDTINITRSLAVFKLKEEAIDLDTVQSELEYWRYNVER